MSPLLFAAALAVAPQLHAEDCSNPKQTVDAIRLVFNCPKDAPRVEVRIFDRKGKFVRSFAEPAPHSQLDKDDPTGRYFRLSDIRISAAGTSGCIDKGRIVVDENLKRCTARYELQCAREYNLTVSPSRVPFALTRVITVAGADGCLQPNATGTFSESEVLGIKFFGKDNTALFEVRRDVAMVRDTYDKERQLRLIEEAFKKEQKERGSSSRNAELINERKKSRLADAISVVIEPVR
jgi:hypothetical protein